MNNELKKVIRAYRQKHNMNCEECPLYISYGQCTPSSRGKNFCCSTEIEKWADDRADEILTKCTCNQYGGHLDSCPAKEEER